MIYKFSFPTLIHFGAGVRHQLGAFLKGEGIQRPLVVTDMGIAPLPFFKELLAELGSAGLKPRGVFGSHRKSRQITGHGRGERLS